MLYFLCKGEKSAGRSNNKALSHQGYWCFLLLLLSLLPINKPILCLSHLFLGLMHMNPTYFMLFFSIPCWISNIYWAEEATDIRNEKRQRLIEQAQEERVKVWLDKEKEMMLMKNHDILSSPSVIVFCSPTTRRRNSCKYICFCRWRWGCSLIMGQTNVLHSWKEDGTTHG